ncbi:hypothetical protein RRG08_059040 [Elysia crispata]|uniref:Uncharacterized protein n=1 Tax=Elysia crispata TaxID=231223 RepID=A0AAE0ZDZ8_9GAST|nr:hypothetical protein RRG08_059040 [Elysia crispata]
MPSPELHTEPDRKVTPSISANVTEERHVARYMRVNRETSDRSAARKVPQRLTNRSRSLTHWTSSVTRCHFH